MTTTEINKLFALLEAFFPTAKPRCKTVKAAWRLALTDYDYETIKAAAVVYAQSGKFFPDLADLTPLCPSRPKPVDPQTRADIDALFEEVPHDETPESLLPLRGANASGL